MSVSLFCCRLLFLKIMVYQPFPAVHKHLDWLRWTSCLHISCNAEWEERFCQILLHVLPLDISMQNRANQTNGLAADSVGCDERGKSVFLAHVQFRFTSCVPSTSSPGILCAPSHRSSVEDPEWDWTPGLHCYLPVSN